MQKIIDRIAQNWDENSLKLSLLGFIILLGLAYFAPSIFISIKSGEAGVLYRRLWKGTDIETVYGEGLHVIAPWNTMTVYSVRLQNLVHDFSIVASNGLSVGVSVSIRFRPKVEFLGVIHKEIGTDYVSKIVIPEIQSLTRNVFSQYAPEELYSTKRSVAQQILQAATTRFAEEYIVLDDLLIQSVTLPPAIKSAVENKLVEEQRYLEMDFRIRREKQEAERRLVEAKGMREFQRLISETLDEGILRYEGIQATLELAKSPNSKVLLIGGRDGLPLIIDTGGETGFSSRTNSVMTGGRTNLFPGARIGSPAQAPTEPKSAQ